MAKQSGMKILWFSHLVPYPETGRGVLQRSYHLVRELARVHEVHVLAFVQRRLIGELLGDVDGGLAQARAHLKQYCADIRLLAIPSETKAGGKLRLAAHSLMGGYPYTIRWLQSESACKTLAELESRTNFDVVHFDTISLAPYRTLLTRPTLTLDHHNIESHMMLRRVQHERDPMKKAYFFQEGVRLARYERQACSEVDLNITCSRLDSDRLRTVVPSAAVSEVPNGVDTNYFHSKCSQEVQNSIVFAGGLSRYANASAMQFFADKIWVALRNSCPEVTMDVVGGNPSLHLRRLAARDKKFRVHGFVPDVRPYIDKAAVYVCPIRDGGGTKLKILDALAMGKAIVAHPVSCEGIDVQDGHDVIFASTPDDFVRKILMLFAQPELRQKLSRNARALAEKTYSYSVVGRTLISAIEQCHAVSRSEK